MMSITLVESTYTSVKPSIHPLIHPYNMYQYQHILCDVRKNDNVSIMYTYVNLYVCLWSYVCTFI